MRELKKSKIVNIGIFREKMGISRFLGDFEIDLSAYFDQDYEVNNFTSALRNHKEFRKRPSYMITDMR